MSDYIIKKKKEEDRITGYESNYDIYAYDKINNLEDAFKSTGISSGPLDGIDWAEDL